MKGQSGKIRGHMVRGTRINDPIRRIIRVGAMDCSVGIGCNEGRVWSLGRGRVEELQVTRWRCNRIAE